MIVPFRDDFASLARCLDSLLGDWPSGAHIIVIDDGSLDDPAADAALAPLLAHRAMVLLRHDCNRGPAAARNSGLAWCREHGIDTVILLDSDCVAPAHFVEQHLAHHRAHPQAVGVGGTIEGAGDGLWARLDRIMSWFSSVPRPDCAVFPPYHVPTTNLSLKLCPRARDVLTFEERLRTGEDVALFRRLVHAGEVVRFTSAPAITHFDRTTFMAMLRHQYRWGLHTFYIRSGRLDAPAFTRLAFALAFIPVAPAYAAVASWLTLRLWLPRHPRDWLFVPLVYLIYAAKAVAVVHGAIVPQAVLFPDEGAARRENGRVGVTERSARMATLATPHSPSGAA